MCGRYSLTSKGREIAEAFGLEEEPEIEARYNIGPGQMVPIVRTADEVSGARQCMTLQWGCQRDAPKGGMIINARSETALERQAFSDSVKRRRCLVPASGFFEWRRQGAARAPYNLTREHRGLFAMAGIWSWWPDGKGRNVESMVILTTHPNSLVSPIHDRMPVILARDLYETWLSPAELDAEKIAAITQPLAADLMAKAPVSTRVNSVANDDPAILVPVEEPPEQLGLF